MTTFEGYVQKKGRFLGLWYKRYLLLQDNLLKIYTNSEKTKCTRMIPLGIHTQIKMLNKGEKYAFDIIDGEKTYSFQANTESNYIDWLNNLLSALHPSSDISMNDFQPISVLGRGFYGEVILARHKSTGKLVAIKSVAKKNLLNLGKIQSVITERNILIQCDNPYIVQLLFSFQTPSKFYLVLEYAQGGDLFHFLRNSSNVSEDFIKMVIAELAIALNHLHQHHIIYRDLKPENVLFCKDGHIKLTDFGISKLFENQNETTSTLCGTSEYLPPEAVSGKQYNYSVDWWQLGVMMYELYVGRTPFYNENKFTMYRNITSKKVGLFPVKDQAARELISALLRKDPQERATFEEIKASNYFKDFDWEMVERKALKPVYIPSLSSEEDVSNFDTLYTKEQITESATLPVTTYFPDFDFISPMFEQQ